MKMNSDSFEPVLTKLTLKFCESSAHCAAKDSEQKYCFMHWYGNRKIFTTLLLFVWIKLQIAALKIASVSKAPLSDFGYYKVIVNIIRIISFQSSSNLKQSSSTEESCDVQRLHCLNYRIVQYIFFCEQTTVLRP